MGVREGAEEGTAAPTPRRSRHEARTAPREALHEPARARENPRACLFARTRPPNP